LVFLAPPESPQPAVAQGFSIAAACGGGFERRFFPVFLQTLQGGDGPSSNSDRPHTNPALHKCGDVEVSIGAAETADFIY